MTSVVYRLSYTQKHFALRTSLGGWRRARDGRSRNSFLLCSFRALNRPCQTDLVLTVLVAAHREFQASQEALDPWDQQELRVHPVARVMQVLVEAKALQVPRDHKDPRDLPVHLARKAKQVIVEAKVPKVPRDLKDPRVLQVHLARKAMQVFVEAKVLQDLLDVTGNSAFTRICTTTGTVD